MGKFYYGNGEEVNIPLENEVHIDLYDILKGKKWLLFGDSITQGGGYHNAIVTKYGMTVINGGFKGGMNASYISGEDNCVLEHLINIDTSIKPDIITIALGTNDYSGAEIGTLEDDINQQTVENFTFIGCYKKLINWIYETYGKTPIVLMTPLPRNVHVKNKVEKYLSDYAQAIRDIGKYYSYPVCDCFSECGIPIGTLTDYSKDTYYFTNDGLHPIIGSGKFLAPLVRDSIAKAMETITIPCSSSGQSGTSYTLTNTNAQRIYVSLQPAGCTDRVVWTSDNENVVKVIGEVNYIYANLYAISNGSANIKATIGDGTVVKNFSVNVSM